MRNPELYKSRKNRRRWPVVLLIILICLIIGAFLLFYGLQKYIVYGPNGLSLELPILASPEITDAQGNVVSGTYPDLVIDQTDYSNVAATAGEGLSAMKAIFVPSGSINGEKINEAAERLSAGNALVLELKPSSGQLMWKSNVPLADSYGVNGTTDMLEIVTALKEKDIWLVAQLSCCVDDLMAERNVTWQLKNADGARYTDDAGGWLDPYSADFRSYIADLAAELAAMGFDEILLANVAHPPVAADTLAYSASSTTPSAVSAVSAFSTYITRSIDKSGAVVSVLATRDAITGAEGNMNGQNIELFMKVYDRIYCYTDANAYETYMNACEKYLSLGDIGTRFVPICYATLPPTDCWVLTDTAN